MSCNQATRSSPFRESFINRPSAGKRSWTRTGRVFTIPKNSRWARPWLFPRCFGGHPGELSRNLELHLKGHCASKVGHLVIKNALVRLASRQRTHRAQGKIFVHAVVCGQRENFADVIATSFIILAHHEGTHGVDEKGTSENCRIAKIDCVIASLG